MSHDCKKEILDNYTRVVSKNGVLSPYKIVKRQLVGKGPVGLYVLSPRPLVSDSIKSVLQIYPQFTDWETDPGTRNIYYSSMLSKSATGEFISTSSYGLLADRFERDAPRYPYIFTKYLVGESLQEIDLLQWTWVEMVQLIFQMVSSLCEFSKINKAFVHGNLHPGNIFILNTPSAESKIYDLDVSKDRTIKVYPLSIQIMDFELSTDSMFPDGIPNYKEPSLLGIPSKLIQMVSQYIGTGNAFEVINIVNTFYDRNRIHKNPDMKVINIYIALFQLLRSFNLNASKTIPSLFFQQQIRYIDTTMFITSSWLTEMGINPIFDIITTFGTPSIELATPQRQPDNSSVHAQVVSKWCLFLPFFGLFLSCNVVDYLMRDMVNLEHKYYMEFHRLTTLEMKISDLQPNDQIRTNEFEWYFNLIIPTVQGSHKLEGDHYSVSTEVISDKGELLVTIQGNAITLHPRPQYNIRLVFPVKALLQSKIKDIVDFVNELKPGSNLSMNLESLTFDIKTFQYNIELSMLRMKGNQRVYNLDKDRHFADIIQTLIPNPDHLLELFLQNEIINNKARWSLGTTSAPHLNISRWNIVDQKNHMDLTDFLLTRHIGGLDENQHGIIN
jgi:hypothetical protein